MRKLFFLVLLAATSFLLAGTFFQRHALACDLLPVLDYQDIGAGMFVVSGTPENEIDALKGFVESASARIESTYGSPTSEPRILVASSAEMAASWGANETASMHRMPWRSCIVIGPEGKNVDVIAHELLHAEIQHRVGFWRLLREIPIWFDEGAALTLDYREPFLPQNIRLTDVQVQAVQDLASARAFFSGDIRANYQAARMAVEPLIENDRFFDDLHRVRAGESFEAVFLAADRQRLVDL